MTYIDYKQTDEAAREAAGDANPKNKPWHSLTEKERKDKSKVKAPPRLRKGTRRGVKKGIDRKPRKIYAHKTTTPASKGFSMTGVMDKHLERKDHYRTGRQLSEEERARLMTKRRRPRFDRG